MANTILITGGAGFIGINAAERFIKDGWQVIIFDNLSRQGTEKNIEYLTKNFLGKFELIKGDIRTDLDSLQEACDKSQAIIHLAAQVAVTTSVENPKEDFEINAGGTLNVLEAARKSGNKPFIIYSSTNKVYGGMEDVEIIEDNNKYVYKDLVDGVSETRQLDFHSPYGCSKGSADQYIRDYSRIYDIPTVVFRQSCIYGPHQFGVEDQGWVAWFIIAVTLGKQLTIYGDGKQVRDVLYVDDLINLYKIAIDKQNEIKGQVYNIGGGAKYTMSLLELIGYLNEIFKTEIKLEYSDWRPGDQKVYISNIAKAKKELDWKPLINPKEGVEKLANWIKENKNLFE